MPTESGQFGSAGTLIAAALETAGGFAQSNILDLISSELGQALAALLFVLAALAALGIITIGGKYKFGPWFLIGPGVFYFCVFWRVPATTVNWSSADFTDQRVLVRDLANGVAAEDADYTVSGVFAHFQSIISGITAALVDSVTNFSDDQTRSMSNLLVSTERYRNALNLGNSIPEHIQFVEKYAYHECGDYFAHTLNYAFADEHNLYTRARDSWQIDPSNTAVIDMYNEQVRPVAERVVVNGGAAQQEIAQLINEGFFDVYTDIDGAPSSGLQIQSVIPPGGTDRVNRPVPQVSYTCEMIFQLTMMSLMSEAQGHLYQLAADNIGPEERMPFHQAFQRNLGNMLTKFEAADGTDATAFRSASTRLAARALMAQLMENPPPLTGLAMSSGQPIAGASNYSFETDFSLWSTRQEGYERNKFIAFSLALPYLQGFILYFLAATFPFFCLVFVVPGRHMAIFTWASLWIWAKLWDVGFAVVLVLDKVFYFLLPSVEETGDIIGGGSLEAMNAFKLALSSDPTYTTYIYSNIMAILISTMPIICGFVVTRGGSFLINRALSGVGDFAHTMGNAGSSMRGTPLVHEIKSIMAQERMEAAKLLYDRLSQLEGNGERHYKELFASDVAQQGMNALKQLARGNAGMARYINSDLQDFANLLSRHGMANRDRMLSAGIVALSLSDEQLMKNAIITGALRVSSAPSAAVLTDSYSGRPEATGQLDQQLLRTYLRQFLGGGTVSVPDRVDPQGSSSPARTGGSDGE